MPVIGVDIGVRRLAIACPEMGWTTHVDLGRRRTGRHALMRHEELASLKRWLWNTMTDVIRLGVHPGDMALVIEQPMLAAVGGSTQTLEHMSEVIGMVLAADSWGSAKMVNVSTWKALLLGYGHADKEDIDAWLRLTAPELRQLCGTEDEVDAMCIGLFGVMLHDGLIEESAPKKRARKKATP